MAAEKNLSFINTHTSTIKTEASASRISQQLYLFIQLQLQLKRQSVNMSRTNNTSNFPCFSTPYPPYSGPLPSTWCPADRRPPVRRRGCDLLRKGPGRWCAPSWSFRPRGRARAFQRAASCGRRWGRASWSVRRWRWGRRQGRRRTSCRCPIRRLKKEIEVDFRNLQTAPLKNPNNKSLPTRESVAASRATRAKPQSRDIVVFDQLLTIVVVIKTAAPLFIHTLLEKKKKESLSKVYYHHFSSR